MNTSLKTILSVVYQAELALAEEVPINHKQNHLEAETESISTGHVYDEPSKTPTPEIRATSCLHHCLAFINKKQNVPAHVGRGFRPRFKTNPTPSCIAV